MQLNQFDITGFLQQYWQQKPLLLRNAIPRFINPLSPDELAGLACESEIESRLIKNNQANWELLHGPFQESVFTSLPSTNWTLLVQAVDHYIPEVAQLLNYFRFIPNWRIDDVMVSYAAQGGSVGPHFDNYDVFLLQGAGRRRWQLGPQCNEHSPLIAGQPLSLLADFNVESEWILETGDVLYVPPGYGHWGTAEDNDCMTYSIGFRAPSHGELLADFSNERLSYLTEQQRYTDPGIKHQQNPGEISAEVISTIQKILTEQLADTEQITDWFGRYMTQTKYPLESMATGEQYSIKTIKSELAQGTHLIRDCASRFAYSALKNKHILYVNGQSFSCKTAATIQLAEYLTAADYYDATSLEALLQDKESFTLLEKLLEQGWIYFDEPFHN